MGKQNQCKDIYHILHNGNEWIAVYKPSGLLTIPDRFNSSLPNLLNILEEQFGKVFPVHRLDQETSGVIIFALTARANKFISEQFSKRLVEKTYLALVRGVPLQPSGEVIAPISEDSYNIGLVRIDFEKGKPAITKWQLLENYKYFSLLKISPLTGRQHQIRVHLQYINLPLAVDTEYGGGNAIYLSEIKTNYKIAKNFQEKPLMARLSLHAYSIKFLPPDGTNKVEIVAPLPADFEITLKQLRKWSLQP